MTATEQSIEEFCPAIGQMVKIKYSYELGFTKICPIFIEVVSRECLISDTCPKYQMKDKKCLLFQDYCLNIGVYD